MAQRKKKTRPVAAEAKPRARGKAGAVKAAGRGKAAGKGSPAPAKGKARPQARAGGKARPRAAAPTGGEARPARPPRRSRAEAAPRLATGLALGRRADEPDPDSYFVARVRGEEAVREAPRPMTEAALDEERPAAPLRAERPASPAGYDEALGDLPWSYGDDALVALPRDPRTLFLYWDQAASTLERAWAGLRGGRPEIWVFARQADGGWERVRVVPFALESRGWYVHDLDPGRVYRAEIHLVDSTQDHPLPRGSNPVELPPVGPSSVIDDRLARIPWGEHLSRWLAAWVAGGPFSEELREQMLRLGDWARFGVSSGAGGMGGRPTSPGGPGSPTSPPGGGR